MSTKTTFKRIALVAVAALGLGVLSVVPSQAAAGAITLTVAQNGTARLDSGAGIGETSTGIIFTVSSLLSAGTSDSITVSFLETGVKPADTVGVRGIMTFLDSTTASSGEIKSNAAGTGDKVAYSSATTDSVTAGTSIILKATASGTPQVVGARYAIQLDSNAASTRKAGTYNFTIIAEGYSAGVKDNSRTITTTATITIAAAAVAATPVPAAANATAYLQAGTSNFAGVLTDSVTAGTLTAGSLVGQIKVTNLTSAKATANDTITVAMTGVGYLKNGSTIGRNFVLLSVANATYDVIADGNSGTGTITITTGAGASFVKTVTFYDTKPSKAVAKVAKAFIKAGTGSVEQVFSVVVTDTAGTAITTGLTSLTAAPTDTATTVGGAATCSTTLDETDKVYYCAVAGLSTTKFGPVAYTIKATGGDAAKTVVSTSATVTFADNVATKAVLAGSASAAPGEVVEYTITLTEKNGYPVADQVYGAAGVEAPGGVLFATRVATGWTTAPFATTDSFTAKSGVIKSKGTMPLAGTATGTWTLAGDGLQTLAADAIDKTIGKTTVTVSTEVANAAADAATQAAEEAAAAAQDATDAALDATTAAEAAGALAQEAVDAVAELSAQVTTLIAALKDQLTKLTNLVIKIQKKVKA